MLQTCESPVEVTREDDSVLEDLEPDQVDDFVPGTPPSKKVQTVSLTTMRELLAIIWRYLNRKSMSMYCDHFV